MSSSSSFRTVMAERPIQLDGIQRQPGTLVRKGPSSGLRRRLLLALIAAPLSAFAVGETAGQRGELRRWGSGEFRRFGFLVYEATLWAADDPVRPPLALKLTYRRNIDGELIAEASIKEIRKLGMADEATLNRWGELMTGLFPDVKPGDTIVGHYLPEGARFTFNEQPLGSIDDPAFARAFFAIWLDPNTSEPDLRAALLTRPTAG
ncbi:MAG TPA: chalcone isomerase family protein [Candidatus Propionivibrio aalborgensis]|nr:chalcone isomerase family protein [Candidatus Propionivibrio aalborgensis]